MQAKLIFSIPGLELKWIRHSHHGKEGKSGWSRNIERKRQGNSLAVQAFASGTSKRKLSPSGLPPARIMTSSHIPAFSSARQWKHPV